MTEDRRGTESARAPQHSGDKLNALKNYRRARGLCFTCGEKWSPGHKCSQTVQLHVVEELLALFQQPEPAEPTLSEDSDEDHTESLLSISEQAVRGTEGVQIVRLHGKVQQYEVIILVDSGSSTSFISAELSGKLKGLVPLAKLVRVKIANGGILQGTTEIPQCSWTCQGAFFQTSLKVLSLDCYDMIVGMDWLATHSPMEVDWGAKWMSFKHQGRQVTLQGIRSDTSVCLPVSSRQLTHREKLQAVAHCLLVQQVLPAGVDEIPPELQALIQEYEELFEEPKGLPPHHSFDHSIPLLPGAQPVNVRPYRYNPEQKSEIEKQVAELLHNGLIKPSASPFASPVLLVEKKDLTWRMCVDYRHLNALTIKNKYPIPVIDELLDELHGAAYFTSLDLRSGYHQIRMREEDEPKTAFQTHHGHYEYKVMSFGLTNAPATFQGVMNTILGSLLRKGVLVFIDDILIYSASFEEHLKLVRQVFAILKEHQLKVKLSTLRSGEIGISGPCYQSRWSGD